MISSMFVLLVQVNQKSCVQCILLLQNAGKQISSHEKDGGVQQVEQSIRMTTEYPVCVCAHVCVHVYMHGISLSRLSSSNEQVQVRTLHANST